MKVYGYSDDLINIEGVTPVEAGKRWVVKAGANGDEFGGDEATLRIGDDKGGLAVTVAYGVNGCWSANVQLIDEGVPIPWPVRVGHQGYTVVVELECPDDVPVELVGSPYSS